MTKRLSVAIAACLLLAVPPLAARAETTGEGPAPEATNPAPTREMNQTDRQEATPPGKDTGPETQAPSAAGSTDADRQRQGSGATGTAAPGSPDPSKPAR